MESKIWHLKMTIFLVAALAEETAAEEVSNLMQIKAYLFLSRALMALVKLRKLRLLRIICNLWGEKL